MRRFGLAVALAALALGPSSAAAQSAPTFACETRSLIVGAAEVNGVRVHCSVNGAPAGDQVLRVIGTQPRPVCEVNLNGGNGECVGVAFGSPEVGGVVAVLEPSGTQYDVLGQVPLENNPGLEYTPIPPRPEDGPPDDGPAEP